MKKVKLKELLTEYSDRNINQTYKAVAVGKYGIRRREDIYSKELSKDISKNKLIYKDTMIIGMGSNQIDIGILTEDEIFSVSPAYTTYKIKNCNPKYLDYLLQQLNPKLSDKYMIISARQGKSVDKKGLLEFEVKLPDEINQRKIAKTLENLDNIIDKIQILIDEKNAYIKSQFVEMFEHNNGICMKTLKMVTSFQQGTQVPIEQQTDEMLEGYKRFLRIIDYTQPPQEARYVNVKGKEVDERSVVVVRYGASSGFVGRGYSGVLANNLFEIHPKNNCISKDFLYYSLKYGSFESVINKKASGAAMPAISFNMIEDIMIPIPDIELQNRFADIVQLIDKQKFLFESIQYQRLKYNLIEKLFVK